MPDSGRKVILRADGGTQIGLGHIYRLLAVYEMLGGTFSCMFAINRPDDKVKKLIESFCPVIELKSPDKAGEIEELKQFVTQKDIVVADGYTFDFDYLHSLRHMSGKLVVVDDMADRKITADIIINHGRSGIEQQYINMGVDQVLCGFGYLLLRNEFLQAARQQRTVETVDSLFICLGGADINNLTLKFLKAAVKVDFIKNIKIVIGAAYQHKQQLTEFANSVKDKTIELFEGINSSDMIRVIQSCQVAISPASTTSLEICCAKSGLITGYSADNQLNILTELLSKECGTSIGDFNTVSESEIIKALEGYNNPAEANSDMEHQAQAIDGLSGERIKSYLN